MSIINVVGLGYIGLPTALMLASNNFRVVGTDINRQVITSLNRNEINFKEKGIDELFHTALNNITFTTDLIEADVYIIAVPTPYLHENKKLDPKYVVSAINEVVQVCKNGSIIVIESTVSPGTINKYIYPLVESKGMKIGRDIYLAHAPERIIPGNMIFELENNARTIGVENTEVGVKLKNIYQSFCKAEITLTDIRTAEMSKVVENTFRDINIAFANELTKICQNDGLNVYEIIEIANKHPRVNILQPGPGVGGHCIPVDPWFLVGDYPALAHLILAARKVNDSMPFHVANRIQEIMKERNIKDISRVGLYGLSYKEDVDDTRESPTLQLLNILDNNLSSDIKVYDPLIEDKIVSNQIRSFNEFLDSVDMIVVMVGHNHIIENENLLNEKVILDTKKIISKFSAHYM